MRSRQRAKLHRSCWISLLLLASTALSDEPADGPPFPRITNVYGTSLTASGGSFHGEVVTVKDVATYDLLVGVHRPPGEAPSDVFREQLEELKKHNPHLRALHFACSAPYTRIAPPADLLASRRPDPFTPWLLQTDGTPIAEWPGTYMLNLSVPEVVQWLAQQTAPAVHEVGYDGAIHSNR